MRLSSKLLVTLLLCVLMCGCKPVGEPPVAETEEVSVTTFSSDSLVLETAAHIPEEQFLNYTLVWRDEETDRAVYIKNNYVPHTEVPIGAECFLGDIPVTVISIDAQGVELSLGNEFAKHGMSGAPITYDGIPFAFVSKATSLNSVYAVFY